MAFDPSDSADAMVQGFTTCDVSDLPARIPSRSPADNLYDLDHCYEAEERNEAFRMVGGQVCAWEDAQLGVKAWSQDAVKAKKVGNYESNGQGKFPKPCEVDLEPSPIASGPAQRKHNEKSEFGEGDD